MQKTGAMGLLVFKSQTKILPNVDTKDRADANLSERSLLRRLTINAKGPYKLRVGLCCCSQVLNKWR